LSSQHSGQTSILGKETHRIGFDDESQLFQFIGDQQQTIGIIELESARQIRHISNSTMFDDKVSGVPGGFSPTQYARVTMWSVGQHPDDACLILHKDVSAIRKSCVNGLTALVASNRRPVLQKLHRPEFLDRQPRPFND